MDTSQCLQCRREYFAGKRAYDEIQTEAFEAQSGDDGVIVCIRTCDDGHRIEDEFEPLT